MGLWSFLCKRKVNSERRWIMNESENERKKHKNFPFRWTVDLKFKLRDKKIFKRGQIGSLHNFDSTLFRSTVEWSQQMDLIKPMGKTKEHLEHLFAIIVKNEGKKKV